MRPEKAASKNRANYTHKLADDERLEMAMMEESAAGGDERGEVLLRRTHGACATTFVATNSSYCMLFSWHVAETCIAI